MAVSGNQKTRLGASISGVGKKMTFSPKSPDVPPVNTLLSFQRGLGRGTGGGFSRGMR